MPATAQTAIAVIGIDIGKNSFHVVGQELHKIANGRGIAILIIHLRPVPAEAEPGEVALQARMLPVEKLDLIEGPPRRAEEQNEPKAIGQIRVSTEIDARIGHG